MFSEIAPRYDFLNHLLSGSLDMAVRRSTARLLRPRAGLVLDVCCGTGDLALAFARGRRGCRVVGVDFSRAMLKIARGKGASGSMCAVLADALLLPFRTGSFDVAANAFGIRNIARARQAMSEMARVAAPGGKAVILELGLPAAGPARLIYGLYLRYMLPAIGWLFAAGPGGAYGYLSRSIFDFANRLDVAQLMRARGLRNVYMRPLGFGMAFICVGTKPGG